MTEALQKMVAAMEAELQEQADSFGRFYVNAVDMEKVARAGLEAIRHVPEAMLAGRPVGWSYLVTAHGVGMMFDALLK